MFPNEYQLNQDHTDTEDDFLNSVRNIKSCEDISLLVIKIALSLSDTHKLVYLCWVIFSLPSKKILNRLIFLKKNLQPIKITMIMIIKQLNSAKRNFFFLEKNDR